MATFSKEQVYLRIQNEAEHFQAVLEAYPDKDTAEYSRLKEALKHFLDFGFFGEGD